MSNDRRATGSFPAGGPPGWYQDAGGGWHPNPGADGYVSSGHIGERSLGMTSVQAWVAAGYGKSCV